MPLKCSVSLFFFFFCNKKNALLTLLCIIFCCIKKKKLAKRDQPKCPICQQRVDFTQWEQHYQLELRRLAQVQSDIYEDPANRRYCELNYVFLYMTHVLIL